MYASKSLGWVVKKKSRISRLVDDDAHTRYGRPIGGIRRRNNIGQRFLWKTARKNNEFFIASRSEELNGLWTDPRSYNSWRSCRTSRRRHPSIVLNATYFEIRIFFFLSTTLRTNVKNFADPPVVLSLFHDNAGFPGNFSSSLDTVALRPLHTAPRILCARRSWPFSLTSRSFPVSNVFLWRRTRRKREERFEERILRRLAYRSASVWPAIIKSLHTPVVRPA